ncbi:BTAD domain-containing putative transcriptional regulator [Actinoplanes sp. TFC3]|uniref:AfsR/SARP family transcriptional regulator n=1 Tax=Actinoplanes sp. TFC3 TaxID=1710355 RepID=UPI00082AA83B|nr:BTAD domain-containing putative transcriptional regulator [Actinoplanes sp. TFC3]
MRFGILGPLLVTGETGHEIVITAGRDRVVLAMLLLQPGRVVGAEELIDAVWPGNPPATARGQLQTCVSRLRRLLPSGTIRTDPAGYGVVLDPEDLDATSFAELAGRAVEALPPKGAESLREALALWRGSCLAGLDSPAVRRLATVLDEQRQAFTEDWVDLELAAGRERDIVAELTGLVENYPLRERLRRQLMLTLHRLGRHADALAEYRRARALYRTELGIEPGAELQELHRRMLSGELLPAPAERPAVAGVRALPRTVSDFTGRTATVDRLLGVAAHTSVLTIDGMPGSGKTTLALQVAAKLADRYPDAQLFLDLQGHSIQEPLDASAALLILLRQLGVAADRIPPGLEARAGLWRSELAARRVLLILDNVASSAQAAPLLPGSPNSLTLVTSRRRLAGLDGAQPESLEVMTVAEAVGLLQRIVGERVTADPAAARVLAQRCGCLPLALRLAGARLAHRPRWQVDDLVRRLGESALPELAAEDRTVADAFALSYRQLPEAVRRLFRLLGLHPAKHFGAVSVAALSGVALDDAQDMLDGLVDVNLIEEPETGRYRLHDLVRQYASALAATLPEQDRRTALAPLIDLHLHAATELNRRKEWALQSTDFPTGAPARPELVAQAVADPLWLEHQRPDLLALLAAAAEAGELSAGWRLARVNWRYLYDRNYLDDLIAVQQSGLVLAERDGDEEGVVVLSNYLASGFYRLGRNTEAVERTTMMLQHEIRVGRRHGEARARHNLGGIYQRMGRLQEAREQLELAYRLYERSGDVSGLTRCNAGLASVEVLLGDPAQALRRARVALQTAVEFVDSPLPSTCLLVIAEARLRLGETAMAERLLKSSLWLTRKGGYDAIYIEAMIGLGSLHLYRAEPQQAAQCNLDALDLARSAGQTLRIAQAQNGLGAALLAMHDREGARKVFEEALAGARRTESLVDEARALTGLGVCEASTDPEAAERRHSQARTICRRVGVPVSALLPQASDSGVDQLRPPEVRGRIEG